MGTSVHVEMDPRLLFEPDVLDVVQWLGEDRQTDEARSSSFPHHLKCLNYYGCS